MKKCAHWLKRMLSQIVRELGGAHHSTAVHIDVSTFLLIHSGSFFYYNKTVRLFDLENGIDCVSSLCSAIPKYFPFISACACASIVVRRRVRALRVCFLLVVALSRICIFTV